MHTFKVATMAVGACIGLFAIGCGSPSTTSGDSGKPIAVTSTSPTAAAKAKYAAPTPADYTLKLTELSRQCFGSAGCNVTFTVELEQVTTNEFDPAKSYRLIYAVEGTAEPYTNNLTITGKNYSRVDTEFTSVKKKGDVLKPTITGIQET